MIVVSRVRQTVCGCTVVLMYGLYQLWSFYLVTISQQNDHLIGFELTLWW